MSDKYTSKCPECGKVIEIDDYSEIGDEIICYHCDAELRIVSLSPVKLKITARHYEEDDFDYVDPSEEIDFDFDDLD